MEYGFFLGLAAVAIFLGLWNAMIGILGLFTRFLAETPGKLDHANTKHNVRSKHGHIIPTQTWFAYTYTVRGRQYRYVTEVLYSKRRLLPRASMVYVKWFPRHAYPYKFKGTKEWVFGILFLFMGCMLLGTILCR